MELQLNPALIGEQEKAAMNRVLESGELKGGGKYDKLCADLFAENFDADNTLMTTSCTHALEMAGLLLEIEEGDEVILPSYTFSSTATAFVLRGAEPVFVDIKPDTLNIDPAEVEQNMSEDTAAIVPVHYAGVGCEMDELMDIADRHDVEVVEDAAQAIDAKYKGEYLGTIGDIGCYSLHETKNFVAGEGGAITMEEEYYERAEILRQKGTNYAQFRRGEVEKYTWVDVGSSYVPSELQMALAHEQLKRTDSIVEKRRMNHEEYMRQLGELEKEGHIRLPTIPDERESNYHIFHIRTETERERERLGEKLREEGIEAHSHYQPLHTSKMGRRYGYGSGDFPVTEETSKTLLRLPVHREVSTEDIGRVVRVIKEFYR